MKQFLFAIVLLFITFCGFSQSTVVQGIVMDSLSKEPIPYVKVKFQNGGAGGLTNLDGGFFIQTSNPSDSIEVSSVGFKTLVFAVNAGISNDYEIFLPTANKSFDAVEIIAGENPAFEILRKVKENKNDNNPEKLEAYQCEVNNVMQFDVNNIGEDFENKKLFKKMDVVNNYVGQDSTKDTRYLPVLLSESISDYYYKKSPVQRKEVIKAVRITGVDYLQLQQFSGDIHQSVNIYDSYIELFNKEFMSPIGDGSRAFYKYYMQQPDTIDGVPCYRMYFVPKRKGDAVFDGEMWIDDSTYAIKRLIAKIPDDVNLNYVSDLSVYQNYTEVEPGVWMVTREEVKAYFKVFNEMKKQVLHGATVHKRTSRQNFIINDAKDFEFYVSDLELGDSAKVRDNDYWLANRHDSLTNEEQGVIDMVDSLKNNRRFKFYENVVYLAYSGFYRAGPIEIGHMYSFYNKNRTEGHRLMLSLRTSNRFSQKVELNGFGIYGFGDKDWKYGASFRWKLKNSPRTMMRFAYRRKIEILGLEASIWRYWEFIYNTLFTCSYR